MRSMLLFLSVLFVSLMFSGCCSVCCANKDITLATFNIRCPMDKSPNSWEERKDRCRKVIKENKFDIFGVQEAFRHQLNDLLLDTDYDFVGVGRDDFKDAGEFSAIIYNRKRFELIKSGTFGLSEKPEVPGYKSWRTACPRIATWGFFKDRYSGVEFLYYNTHLDHVSELARVNGIKLIVEHAKKNAKDVPMILSGDFNAKNTSEVYKTASSLLDDSAKVSATPHQGPIHTYTNYGRHKNDSPIDYIFVSKDIKVLSHKTDDTRIDGKYPSDHDPVVINFVFLPETK